MGDSLQHRVAAELRAQLARQRVTQTDLADKLGKNATVFSHKLSGRRVLTVPDIDEIAGALDLVVEVTFLPGKAA